jgi:uncharacterized protein YjbI with pentapeptide repeats
VLDKDAGSWFIVDSSNTVIVSVMVEEKGRQTADKKEGRKPWTLREFGGQTVWDWLHLLSALAIPVVLAAAGLWFTAQQDQRQVAIENDRAGQVLKIENQRAKAERELADQRAQDEALQAYLSQMSTLLLEKNLRTSEEDNEVRTLARARTLTVLGRLDPSRKPDVMQFLVEAKLVQRVEGSGPIINLSYADLKYADLKYADLNSANLQHADLSPANLQHADLIEADLSHANLSDANLSDANLFYANLSHANLSHANLSHAYLHHADLREARRWTEEQLRAASSLEGATMPNGQKYEDWLKDEESRK